MKGGEGKCQSLLEEADAESGSTDISENNLILGGFLGKRESF